MNIKVFKNFLTEKNIKIPELAESMGINRSTLYRKIQKDGEAFSIREMNQIIEITGMNKSEAAEIFFNEKLA